MGDNRGVKEHPSLTSALQARVAQAVAEAGGWLPVPRKTLPFRSLVATSDNDPLADRARVLALAKDWGSETVDLGAVGHLNPASGYGEWPMASALIKMAISGGMDQAKI